MIYDYSALANYQPEESVIYVVRRFGSLWFHSLSEELQRVAPWLEFEHFCNRLALVVLVFVKDIFKLVKECLLVALDHIVLVSIVGIKARATNAGFLC